MEDEAASKFLDRLSESGHNSPIEHANFTFAVTGVSRSLLAQITRHRIASFCLAGDTIVGYNERQKGMTIKELAEKTSQYKSMTKLRSVDENTHEIFYNKVVDAWYSGEKEVYTVETFDGYSIKSTLDHKFLTDDGWKALREIHVGESIYTNGIEAYKSKDWLNEKYLNENLSQKEIAEICGVSHHTIRSWIRRLGLQKQLGSWCIGRSPHNKGKTKDDYEPLKRVSEKQQGRPHPSKREYHRSYPSKTNSGGYNLTHKTNRKNGVCEICGEMGQTEYHHIDRNPKNWHSENIMELCVSCHKRMHKGASVMACKPSKVKSITKYGVVATYDVEMLPPYNNFVANGFVVHNSVQSQRYVNEARFNYVTPEAIQNNQYALRVFDDLMDQAARAYADIHAYLMSERLKEKYGYMITHGGLNKAFQNNPKHFYLALDSQMDAMIKNPEHTEADGALYKQYRKDRSDAEKFANENARSVLPNATATNFVVTMNGRELKHFFSLRCCNRAQDEIRELANKMLVLCKQVAPNMFKNAGPGCVAGPCPEGKMSCGRPYTEVKNEG